MKRNWLVIGAIILLILGYKSLILDPYNKKYAPPPPITEVAASNVPGSNGAPSGSISAAPGSTLQLTPKKLLVTDEDRKVGEKIEVNDTRFFSVFPDGTLGDVVFTKYFQRGKAIKEPSRILENGLHWSSSDVRVQSCLKSLHKVSNLVYQGEAEGVKCTLTYKPDNILISTTLVLESTTELKGAINFEAEESVGDGAVFDHKYLTIKKKDEKVSKIREKNLWNESIKASGPFDFIAWGDKYFAATLMPKGKYNPDIFYKAGATEKQVNWGVSYPLKWSAENTKVSYDFDVYFAIKDLQELHGVRADLGDMIDFGFFGAIARFMLWSLEELNKIFKNYGVAIIILSLVVRLLLWPINRKMFESGQKMKDIQPQMEAIKKKYEGKNDQMMTMNQEIRQLYSKQGVNPLGSCLPMFLQIPIFFGLNSALSNSVDLYQAPFFGWITDLSYKDPLYILPVIWTVSLIISVELNPQPQPSQPGMPDMKWVSRVMFLVFGFISKDFPSGLTLYFLVSNLAGMFQQWLFRKKTQMASQNILLWKER